MSVVHFLGTVIASCIHLASLLESGKIEGEAEDLIEGKKLVVPNVSLPPDDLPEVILMITVARSGICRIGDQRFHRRLPSSSDQEPPAWHVVSLGRVR